jgi:hypothetical protein
MKMKLTKIRADFDYALSLDNGFGRKMLTVMLLTQIGILGATILRLLNA